MSEQKRTKQKRQTSFCTCHINWDLDSGLFFRQAFSKGKELNKILPKISLHSDTVYAWVHCKEPQKPCRVDPLCETIHSSWQWQRWEIYAGRNMGYVWVLVLSSSLSRGWTYWLIEFIRILAFAQCNNEKCLHCESLGRVQKVTFS